MQSIYYFLFPEALIYNNIFLDYLTFKWFSIFLYAIWLPHNQFWAVIEGTFSLTKVKVYWKPRNKNLSLNPDE